VECSQPPDDLDQAEQKILSFAESVDTGPQQLRAPFAFGYLPSGTRLRWINATADRIDLGIAKSPADSITVALTWPPQTQASPGDRPVQVNGRAGRMDARGVLRVSFGTFDLVVNALTVSGDLEEDTVLAIAKGVRVADPKDRSQWFPAVVGLSPK
jgi:hypothetical protein